jgi:hypothetical protein
MSNLSHKITQAAKTAIEQQEETPAKVEEWRLIGVNHPHQITVAVSISTHKTNHNANFEVWLLVDIATEKIVCI